MVRVQVSQLINQPPDEVFRHVATDHFYNHPKWDPNVIEMVQTSTGPMDIGTTARLVRLDRGKRIEGTVEISEYDPVRRFTAVISFGPFLLYEHADIEPIGKDSSCLTLTIDNRATGLMRVLLPVLRGTFRRTMAESLRRVKEMVD